MLFQTHKYRWEKSWTRQSATVKFLLIIRTSFTDTAYVGMYVPKISVRPR